MSKKKGLGKFILGTAVGVGIGMLLSPKSGKENLNDLKNKINELKDEIKKIDIDEVKETFTDKINEIQKEIEDLNKEKVLKIAKEKAKVIKKKSQELVDLAIDKSTPVVRDYAENVRVKAVEVTKEVLNKLEK